MWGRMRTEIHSADLAHLAATGELRSAGLVKKSGWTSNLVFDTGLNLFANAGTDFRDFFATTKIGGGTNPNSINSGAITFTQVGTTITASGSFFTSGMTGAILKYGTGSGGVEQYITFTSALTATSATSMTVSVATVGTVWMVQQIGLQTLLFSSNTYSSASGANTTTFSTNNLVLQSTTIFGTQVSPYTVNEIGYHTASSSGATCNGRIVLSSSDVVNPSQFYVVVTQMTYTVNPSPPVSVGNMGTNFNSAGTAAIQAWMCHTIASNGSSSSINLGGSPSGGLVEGGSFNGALVTANTISLNTTPITGTPPNSAGLVLSSFTFSNSGQPVGIGVTATLNFTFSTSVGFIYGFEAGSVTASGSSWQQLLTTPQATPAGTYQGSIFFTIAFTRTLVN